MKLLIVEDEKSLSRSICEYLRMEGHICEYAYNYKDALIKTADNNYNYIILDIGLTDGNGLDVIRHMKENRSTDGILILSARSSLEDKLT
jgi:DNA-binding response OmpR family regulator